MNLKIGSKIRLILDINVVKMLKERIVCVTVSCLQMKEVASVAL